jgi:flavin reductase (DIM6/NTAB) family NADH-FMN oxidoreductase RutF
VAIDQYTFRAVLGRFATGVTVVTTVDDRCADHGMTVSAFCSLSLEPPLVLICIDKTASVYPALAGAASFAVNILASGQEALSRRFAEHLENRFEGIGFARGRTGAPLLHDALAHLECETRARHDGGDHTIIVGEVIAAAAHAGRPLLYYRGGYAQLER